MAIILHPTYKKEVYMRRSMKDKGFTLVELAIVLVIIGLLLAAVLRGSEMVRNARIKAVQNDLRGYFAAVYTFLDRMGRLPGDTDRDGQIDDTDPFDELESENIAVKKTCPFGGDYNIEWANGIPAESGNYSANTIWVDNIPVEVARIIDDKMDDGLADNTPGNDSGRKTGSFRYDGTSGRVKIYFLLD